MAKQKNLYINEEWHSFAEKVKRRDGHTCLKCGRSSPAVILQVHHENYVPNKHPWQYALSDCTTLCRGCHAREHGLIEPDRGWFLLSIDDLGDLIGTCERTGCGTDIRYEHVTYHPEWGYKKAGSTCIEHLTQKDKALSGKVLACYRNVSKFVHSGDWYKGKTKNGKDYVGAKHGHDLIRIYGSGARLSFQLALKTKGRRYYHYQDFVPVWGKTLEETKELAYIALKGSTTENEEEKALLRSLYQNIK